MKPSITAHDIIIVFSLVLQLKIHYCGGYGFTVRNTRPVTVGRVKPAGAAYRAGLHSGDVVTKVNGRNLDLLSAEDAALMVRYGKLKYSLLVDSVFNLVYFFFSRLKMMLLDWFNGQL